MFRLLINIINPQLKDLPEETPLIRIFRVSRPRKPVQDTSLPYCKDPFFLPSIPDTLPSFPPEKIRTVPGSRDKKRTSSHKLLVRIHNTQSHFHTAAGYFRLGNVQGLFTNSLYFAQNRIFFHPFFYQQYSAPSNLYTPPFIICTFYCFFIYAY